MQTTLDERVEAAADTALQSVTDQPTALVAVRISTGQVIAVANGPSGGGFDTALLGAVPPGSAFKIVTTTALLEKGLNVNAPVVCSPQILVEGKTFHNYEGEQLGSVPFHTDFAKSCNTAFISLAPRVPDSTLFGHRAGARYRRVLVAWHPCLSRQGRAAQGSGRSRRDLVRAGLDFGESGQPRGHGRDGGAWQLRSAAVGR